MVSTVYVPRERLCTTRCLPDLRTAPQAEAPEQRKRPPSRKDQAVCLSLLPLLCPWGRSLQGTASPIAAVLWDPKMQGLATRQSGAAPGATATNLRQFAAYCWSLPEDTGKVKGVFGKLLNKMQSSVSVVKLGWLVRRSVSYLLWEIISHVGN